MTNQGIIYPKLSEGTLTPAYGRDYSNETQVIQDFRSGKDFNINFPQGQTLCSIRNGLVGEMVKFRYHKQTKAFFYTITTTDFVQMGR